MRKRIAYSQNFLKDKNLIVSLINKSSIIKEDVVYEIGAGEGIITEQLLKRSRKVVSFEIDKNLFAGLLDRFRNESSLDLNFGNFLDYSLPNYPYKVFSNIPFNITSEIVKKLTKDDNPPQDAYLIVQEEAARKFVGKPFDNKNTQVAILLKPWFELEIEYRFQRESFSPVPDVNIVLLRIKKREEPLIKKGDKFLYDDFISYVFNHYQSNKIRNLLIKTRPGELDFADWVNLFNQFLSIPSKEQNVVSGSYNKLLREQGSLEKVHRTRVDKEWKKYR